MPLSPPKPILPNQSFNRTSFNSQQQSPKPGQEAVLESAIERIGSSECATALQVIIDCVK